MGSRPSGGESSCNPCSRDWLYEMRGDQIWVETSSVIEEDEVLSRFTLLDDDVGLRIVIVYVAIMDPDRCVTPNGLSFQERVASGLLVVALQLIDQLDVVCAWVLARVAEEANASVPVPFAFAAAACPDASLNIFCCRARVYNHSRV